MGLDLDKICGFMGIQVYCVECIHKDKCENFLEFRTGCIFENEEVYRRKFNEDV